MSKQTRHLIVSVAGERALKRLNLVARTQTPLRYARPMIHALRVLKRYPRMAPGTLAQVLWPRAFAHLTPRLHAYATRAATTLKELARKEIAREAAAPPAALD